MSRKLAHPGAHPASAGRRHFVRATLGGAAALALGHRGTAFAQDDAALRTLYDAAKKEGEMTWYVSLYGDTIAKRTAEAFNKKYPGVTVAAVRRTTGSTFQKVNQDLQANTPVAGVVSMSAIADYYEQLKARGALMQYTPVNASKLDKSMQSLIDPGYAYPMGAGLMAIAYNSAKVTKADAPKSWSDLADPKWKGKLALSSPAFSGFDAALDVILMRKLGWGYFEKLEKNSPLIQRSTFDTITAISSGERLVATMPDGVAIEAIQKGNSLALVYPTDGSILIAGLTGIMKNAQQPNTAKLFTEFLLGVEHAQICADAHYVPARPEVAMVLPTGQKLSEIPTIAVQPSAELGKDLTIVIQKWRDTFG
jgi:iron(III) transport system substrate-binding protein